MLYKTIRKFNGSDISGNKSRDLENEHPSKNNKSGCLRTSKQMYDSNDANSRKSTLLYFYHSFIACRNMASNVGGGSSTITRYINYSKIAP